MLSTAPAGDLEGCKCNKGFYGAVLAYTQEGTTKFTAECTACLAGMYQASDNITSIDACVDCPPGKYTSTPAATSCFACPEGTISSTNRSLTCLECGPGKYSNVNNVECHECDVFTFSTTSRASSPATCMKCGVGMYSSRGSSRCTECPSNSGPVSGCVQCESAMVACKCNRGYTLAEDIPLKCVACNAGTYKIQNASNEGCTQCPALQSSPPGSFALSACECIKGTTASASSRVCTACVQGKFKETGGPAPCMACTAGSYSAAFKAESQTTCSWCTIGKYAFSGASVCISCEPGKSMLSSALMQDDADCIACLAGSFSTASTTAGGCTTCEPGKYSDIIGATSCLACAIGKFFSLVGGPQQVGASSGLRCLACSEGSFGAVAGLTACSECSPGKYLPVKGGNAESKCRICSAGTYAAVAGAVQCTSCPAGKYGDLQGLSDCLKCPGGSYSNWIGGISADSCVVCASAKYAFENATGCGACPLGSNLSEPAGDLFSCICIDGFVGPPGGPCQPAQITEFDIGFSTFVASATNLLTLRLASNKDIPGGALLRLSGLTGAQTKSGLLQAKEAYYSGRSTSLFLNQAMWNRESATLNMTLSHMKLWVV